MSPLRNVRRFAARWFIAAALGAIGRNLRASIVCGIGLLVALSVGLASLSGDSIAREPPGRIAAIDTADLPAEARDTIALIRKGGPFPYRKDGTVFGNFEKRLPLRERGYYLEYTVPTPGARDRGARRIVAGKTGELYYTNDHYQSFKRVRE